MGFGDAVRTCLMKYATFTGRAARPEYWWFVLLSILIAIVGMVAELMEGALGGVLWVGYILVSLALLLPALAVAARRLHDVGRSGWWLLLSIIPLLGSLLLLYWMARRGDPGPNAYGPPPV